MKVLHYEETVVWEDPLIVLIEETLQYDDGGTEASTFTVYSGGERLFTAITSEGAWRGIYDIIGKLEDTEDYA